MLGNQYRCADSRMGVRLHKVGNCESRLEVQDDDGKVPATPAGMLNAICRLRLTNVSFPFPKTITVESWLLSRFSFSSLQFLF
jgi:hypothetical protein